MKNIEGGFSIVQDILNKTEEELSKIKPIHIIIAGKTGVGKSTLINQVFREKLAETGIGKPVTKHIRHIQKKGVPISLYDTRGLELDPIVQNQIKKEITDLLNKQKQTKEKIDCVYYCIQSNSGRIEQTEIDFIEELSKQVPIIIVLTQYFGPSAEELKQFIEQLNLSIVAVVPVMAKDFQIDKNYTVSQFGLKQLIDVTLQIIPEESKEAFINAQQADIDKKIKAARSWANRYILTIFGVGFIPIPFSDASILIPMQVTLIAHITAIFGFSIDKSKLLSIVSAVGGTGGATMLGKNIVSNALKFIPGAGTLVGGLIGGTTAAIITSALAMSYIEVLGKLAQAEANGKEIDLKNIEKLMNQNFKQYLKRNKGKSQSVEEVVALNKEKGGSSFSKPLKKINAKIQQLRNKRHSN
ncbi:YcjF family protein [Lacticigenium naphthae]|uniref:YcjF family protein n=1 Tax=Lacticigenium naphthae TaxID=515351 RepID=UPI000409469A|nr:GTPase [Lacticigenium naphthae]